MHIFESFIRGLDKKTRLTSIHDKKVADLYKACKEGDIDTLRELLSDEEDIDINVADYDGRTPLHIARAERHTDCVNVLLQRGAKPDAEDRWGNKAISDND